MTDNVTRLPEPGLTLDLDLETRPEKDIRPPFVVKVGERKLTLRDPAEIDWRDLASVEIPADLLRVAMTAEERRYLTEQALPAWKFNRLMEAYYVHYDLEEKLENARRQARLAQGR